MMIDYIIFNNNNYIIQIELSNELLDNHNKDRGVYWWFGLVAGPDLSLSTKTEGAILWENTNYEG